MLQNNPKQQKTISWQALEYPEHNKHPLWFIGLGIVTALLVLYGIYTESWTMAVVFGMFGILASIYAAQKPEKVTITLTGAGVQINTMMYSYRVIKKFWINYYPPEVKTLYLETAAYFDNTVRIELGDQDPRVVKDYLKRFVEEDLDHAETLTDVIARKLKF